MKKILYAWIEQVIEFDTLQEENNLALHMIERKIEFQVISWEELPNGRTRVHIRKRYNNSPLPPIDGMEG